MGSKNGRVTLMLGTGSHKQIVARMTGPSTVGEEAEPISRTMLITKRMLHSAELTLAVKQKGCENS